jgi:hypothetical protein
VKKQVGIAKKCSIKGCTNNRIIRKERGRPDSNFCYTHKHKSSINSYLGSSYYCIRRRVLGKSTHNRGNWKGKPLVPPEVFKFWARNNPEFLKLYKIYATNGYPMSLAPSVNRIDSNGGYTLDNMEWMTHSQNSALSGSVRKNNNKERKMVYKILGVRK